MNFKRTLIATALLGAIGASAYAEDSAITIYGRADAAIGQDVGSAVTGLRQGKGSLLGFKGNENLGSGYYVGWDLQSTVNLPNGAAGLIGNGTTNTPNQTLLFDADTIVKIGNDYGWIDAGRRLTPAWKVSINGDPWETYGGYVTHNNNGLHANHLFTSARFQSAISANYSHDGWFASAMFAQDGKTVSFATPPVGLGPTVVVPATVNGVANTNGLLEMTGKRPESFSAGYNKGPLYAGLGYEKTPYNSSMVTGTVNYDFGFVLLRAGVETGSHKRVVDNVEDVKATNYIIGATVPYGNGQLMFSYDALNTKVLNASGSGMSSYNVYPWTSRKLGAGYQYFMSKRTWLYVDIAHDTKATVRATGWDMGIVHHF
ncbi:porin [Collimonas antrihumi]|uniref:porin n=1 Tax=Collimonas antrihumi TaxID=1940615 RepID=UPI001B8CB8A2|nr:porin [Collimonas antrihumi]